MVRSTLSLLKSSLNEFETIEKTREETDSDGSGFNLIVFDCKFDETFYKMIEGTMALTLPGISGSERCSINSPKRRVSIK